MPKSDKSGKAPKMKAAKTGKKTHTDSSDLAPNSPLASLPGAADKYAPTAWGGAVEGTDLHDVIVPSGQLVQIRHVGPTGLVQMGLLDSLDMLGAIVQTEHVERVSGRKPSAKDQKARIDQEMKDILADPKKIMAAMDMMDKVVCGVVVRPRVNPVPVPRKATEEEIAAGVETDDAGWFTPERILGQVYVDSVDLEDKGFILNFVMGAVNSLGEFREELATAVADLEPVQDVPMPTKRAAKRARAASSVPA
jgi:hypothetical protein